MRCIVFPYASRGCAGIKSVKTCRVCVRSCLQLPGAQTRLFGPLLLFRISLSCPVSPLFGRLEQLPRNRQQSFCLCYRFQLITEKTASHGILLKIGSSLCPNAQNRWKKFPIRQYKSNSHIKVYDFCEVNHISTDAFQKWIKQYDEGGLRSISRAGSEIKNVLLEGINPAEEFYPLQTKALRGIESSCPRLKKGFGKNYCRCPLLKNNFPKNVPHVCFLKIIFSVPTFLDCYKESVCCLTTIRSDSRRSSDFSCILYAAAYNRSIGRRGGKNEKISQANRR